MIDKQTWLHQEIWPQIHGLMRHDGYFKLWLKAQEIAKARCGPVAEMIIAGHVTYQLVAVRRICDTRKGVISLPRLLRLIQREQPYRKAVIDELLSRLETECEELNRVTNQHIAHNADPTKPHWQGWDVPSAKVKAAQKAICEVAIIIERDLLAITHRVRLIPVPQFDNLFELATPMLLPAGGLDTLREFWREHTRQVDQWAYCKNPLYP